MASTTPNRASISLLCTETSASLPPLDLFSRSPSLAPTEPWPHDEIAALNQTDGVDDGLIEKDTPTRWVSGNSGLVSYVGDKINIKPDGLCTMSYLCCLCGERHPWSCQLVPGHFDPTSVAFMFGPAPTRLVIAACTESDKSPDQIQLSFRIWQKRHCSVIDERAPEPLVRAPSVAPDEGASGSVEPDGAALEAVIGAAVEAAVTAALDTVDPHTTPVSRKRSSASEEEAPGAPRRPRGYQVLSMDATKIVKILEQTPEFRVVQTVESSDESD